METSLKLMRKQTQTLGHPVTNHVIIIDLESISLKKSTSHGVLMIVSRIIKLCSGAVCQVQDVLKYVLQLSPIIGHI